MPFRILSFIIALAALAANGPAGLAAAGQSLVFVPNAGQDAKPVLFTSRGPGYSLYFTAQEAIFQLGKKPDSTAKLRLRVLDSRPDVAVSGVDALTARVNYLIGNDPEKWHTGIGTYGQVAYRKVLDGIDLLYYGHDGRLEYDFRLEPGAHPSRIQMALDGGDWKARVTPAGDLEIRGAGGAIRFARPVAYQLRADGSRQPVKAAYALKDGRHFGFHVGRYDRLRELVIDPTFVYSEYYGGSGNDEGAGIARDSQGNTFIVGSTGSTNLPGLSTGYQTINKGLGLGGNAFAAKFNSSGQLLVATYLGGSNFTQGIAIAVDGSGNPIVVGQTGATDFPLQNAVQTTCALSGAVDRFTCAYSTYSACGGASNQTNAFITKLDSTLSHLIYSTYFGGSANTNATSVTVNAAGEAFVSGSTMSNLVVHDGCSTAAPACGGDPPDAFGVPTTSDAYMRAPLVSSCALTSAPFWNGKPPFVDTWFGQFSPSGALLYSSYFIPTQSNGGQQTLSAGIALDNAGGVYLAGSTNDTGFPAIPGTTSECNNCNDGSWNGWVAKFNLNASGASQLLYANLFGGSADDTASGIAVDQQGNAYVVGNTRGADFPTTAGSFQPSRPADGSKQGFVAKVNEQGTALSYASYIRVGPQSTSLDGIAVDGSGAATVAGTDCGIGCGTPATFLYRMTPDGSTTSYATEFVTFGIQDPLAVVVDNGNNAFFTGTTVTFPVTMGGSCANLNNCGNGNSDAFLAEINMGAGPANPITATTTIASNATAPSSTTAQPITLTAFVTGGTGVNAGSVMFTLLGTNVSAMVSGGMASANFTVPGNTPPGNYPIQAVYVPAGSFGMSSDTTHMLTTGTATSAPTVSFTGAPTSAPYNSTFTVTAATNASTMPVITASGACSAGPVTGTPANATATITMTSSAGTCSLTATWAADSTYATATKSQSSSATQARPTITWASPAAITYGTALGALQLNATASTPGTFTYSPAAGTVLNAGANQTLSVTFTPTDFTNYSTVTTSVQITINQAVPSITWTSPAAIAYGTALSASQLNATAGIAGTFAYSPALGTVLNAGVNQTLSVTFTPTDSINYSTATVSVQITVNKATPAITWSSPAAITYGTPLGAAQLNATASVPGTFVYSPSAGASLTAGVNQTLSVIFTPTDSINYSTATASVQITVSKATPSITWSNPEAITYGTALGAAQLNATASVPGTFAYTPAAGTILPAGNSLSLSATFTPTDSTNNSTATANTTINVNRANASVTPNPAVKNYGQSDPSPLTTGVLAGFVAADNITATYTRSSGETPGMYTINATLLPAAALGNYNITYNTANFTINKANASVTPNAAAKTYGAADPAFTGSVSGFLAADNVTATYSRTPGEAVAGSPYTISAALSPAAALVNYNITYNTANFTINKVNASVTPNAAAKTYGAADPTFTGSLNGFLAGDNVTATYSRTSGETVGGSPYTISAALSPAAALVNYNITYNTANFTITKGSPTITWGKPAAIAYGTALSSTQLNATANVAGTFVYTPAAGKILPAGAGQMLSVSFTPSDAADYNSGSANTTIDVNKAQLTATVTAASKSYDATAAAVITGCTLTGVVPGDTVTCSAAGASFSDANVGSNKTVTATGIMLGSAQAGNYILPVTTAITTANITPASTTISLSNLVQAYDGAQKTVNAISGLTICGPVTLNYSPTAPVNVGSYTVTATPNPNCAGSATDTLIIYAYAAAGSAFVIGDLSAASQKSQTFWGEEWATANSLSGGRVDDDFKGFAVHTSSTPPQCGGTWTNREGNSAKPPATIPAYMAVVVSSSITQTGDTLAGNIGQIVVVKTNPGYAPNPGHAGTGIIVAQFCK